MENKNRSTKGFNMQLSNAAVETLRALFMDGPLFDGDVPSKSGRDETERHGLSHRVEGFSCITPSGVRMALENGMGDQKWTKSRDNRVALEFYDKVRRLMSIAEGGGTINTEGGGYQGAQHGESVAGDKTKATVASENYRAAGSAMVGHIYPTDNSDTVKKPFSFERNVEVQTESLQSLAKTLGGFMEVMAKQFAA